MRDGLLIVLHRDEAHRRYPGESSQSTDVLAVHLTLSPIVLHRVMSFFAFSMTRELEGL